LNETRKESKDMAVLNTKQTRSTSTLSMLSACIAMALANSTMAAGTAFTVTRAADDENPGSLRSAINAANAQPGADVISFAGGLGPIVLNGTDLAITESLSIIGPAARQVISGNQQSSIFRTNSFDVELVLENLRLIDGQSAGSGGAIDVQGPLTVRNSILSGNSTTTSFDPGGAIAISVFNERSPALIEDSLFENNRTLGDNSFGGAIHTRGTLTIRNSTFRNNQTQGATSAGGAISAGGDFFELFDSVVEGNTVLGNNGGGGGISTNTLDNVVVNSIVRENRAEGAGGGGIQINAPASDGSLELRDSTVSGNRAATRGGGVYSVDTIVSIINSTISENSGLALPVPVHCLLFASR
jgi:predicted outer membrane repeat protein